MFLYLNHPVPHREENGSSHRRDALVLAVAAVVLSAIIINVCAFAAALRIQVPAEALFIHFIPTRRRFAIARVCVVADRGLISAETLVGRLDELVVRFLGQDDRFSEHARRR